MIRTHLMRLRQKLGEDGENPTYIFRRAQGVSMRRIGQTAVNREADEGRGPFLGTAMRHSQHALGAPPGR